MMISDNIDGEVLTTNVSLMPIGTIEDNEGEVLLERIDYTTLLVDSRDRNLDGLETSIREVLREGY